MGKPLITIVGPGRGNYSSGVHATKSTSSRAYSVSGSAQSQISKVTQVSKLVLCSGICYVRHVRMGIMDSLGRL